MQPISPDTVLVGGCELQKDLSYLYADSSRLFYKRTDKVFAYDLAYLNEPLLDVHCAPYAVTLVQTASKLLLFNYLKDPKRLVKHRLYRLPKDLQGQTLQVHYDPADPYKLTVSKRLQDGKKGGGSVYRLDSRGHSIYIPDIGEEGNQEV